MMTDQTHEAMYAAAFGDLRYYVRNPSVFPQRSMREFAESLWAVYLCRLEAFASLDAFLDECVRRVSLAKMRGAK